MMAGNRSLQAVVVAGAFAVLAILVTWPIAADPSHYSLIGPEENDAKFLLWSIFWGTHALGSNPLHLLDANIFYPEPYTYLYSDIQLANSLLAAPAIALTYNPDFVYTVLVWLFIIIGGTGFFLFAYDMCSNGVAAFVAALLFQLNPAHFGRYHQLHLFGDHWMPWFLWSLVRWLRGRDDADTPPQRARWAAATVVFYALTVFSSSHIALFATLLGGFITLFFMFRLSLWRRPRFWIGLVGMAVGAVLLIAPVIYPLPFIQGKLTAGRVQNPEVLEEGSAGLVELTAAGSVFYRWWDDLTGWPSRMSALPVRGMLFPGIVIILLAFSGFLRREQDGRRHFVPRKVLAWTLDWIVLLCAWTALIFAITGARTMILPVLAFPTPPLPLLLVCGGLIGIVRLAWLRSPEHTLVACLRWCRTRLHARPSQLLWLGLVVLGIWLSLGPAGGLYRLISDLPLIRIIRVPRRFTAFSLFGLAALSAYGMAALLRRFSSARARLLLVSTVVGLFAVESWLGPLQRFPVAEPHPMYHWLGEQPGKFTVVEFPIDPWGYRSFIRQQYASIHHWKNLVVGYSGYQSDENIALLRALQRTFPGSECMSRLAELDTRYVIVFLNRLDPAKRDALEEQKLLRKVKSYPGIGIYELTLWRE